MSGPAYRTGIGTSDPDSIKLLGHDLAGELIGRIGFGELAYWLLTNRRPTTGQQAMFDAVLVALADHGFTPTAIAPPSVNSMNWCRVCCWSKPIALAPRSSSAAW